MTAKQCERTDLLFLCVANSARSQLAEGLARTMAPKTMGVHSAGSDPSRLNPLAVEVLAEIGIDISDQRAKAIDEVPSQSIATVVTLCRDEVCPIFPGEVERLHWPLPDPAGAVGSEAEKLEGFRATRDAIRSRLQDFFDTSATDAKVKGTSGKSDTPRTGAD